MPFADRVAAGRALAEALAPRLAGRRARVFGLARGGVIVGRPLSARLGGGLEVLVACKVPAPGQPELAVGAVAEGGGEFWDPLLLAELRLDAGWREAAARRARQEVERRRALYRDHPLRVDPAEVAVVTDDGIATGSTVIAALRGLASLGARERAVATPVAAREALHRIVAEAAWVEALEIPTEFSAVGASYADFDPVEDEALIRALAPLTAR